MTLVDQSLRLIHRSLFLICNQVLKASKPIGSISQRRDGKYKKIGDGKWVKVKETKQKEDKQENKEPIKNINTKANDEAIKKFGITNNINEAGYILTDGRMLDFSAKREGGDPGERVRDHREVSDLAGLSKNKKDESGSDKMIQFMDEVGAMRIDNNSGIVNTVGIPGTKQIQTILRHLKDFGDSIYLEINDKNGDPVHSQEIENPKAKDIINFFNNYKEGQKK